MIWSKYSWWRQLFFLPTPGCTSPSSYLSWTWGTGWPGALHSGLHLLSRLRSLWVHAFQGRTASLGVTESSNHWCTVKVRDTNNETQDKNKIMRWEHETLQLRAAQRCTGGVHTIQVVVLQLCELLRNNIAFDIFMNVFTTDSSAQCEVYCNDL